MEINFKTFKIVHVGRTNPNFEYFMNGERLTETSLERDIGVLLDKSLKAQKPVHHRSQST